VQTERPLLTDKIVSFIPGEAIMDQVAAIDRVDLEKVYMRRISRSLFFLLLSLLAASTVSSPASAQYVVNIDQNFNLGYPLEDRFAGSASASYSAQRIARLTNGDVVVAGLVPLAYGSAGLNLGLARYDQSGNRIAWSNPTSTYVSYFNRYITYPNNGVDTFSQITGIAVNGSRIYVQINRPIGGEQDSKIVAFSDDGQFIGEYGAFTTALREDGGGIVTYAFPLVPGLFARRLIAVATYINGSERRVVTIKRFVIASDGSLSVDNGFGPYGNGANDLPFPDSACQQQTQCWGLAEDTAIAGADTDAPRVYVAGYTVRDSVNDLRPAMLGIDGQTGNPLPNFGVSGVYVPSTIAVSMFLAFPPRITAQFFESGAGTFDRIYVLWPAEPNGEGFANIQRYYSGSPAGNKLKLDPLFGFEGTFYLGCCVEAAGLAAEGDTVAVVGNRRSQINNGPILHDPFILTIYGYGGSAADSFSFLSHDALRIDTGTRWGDANWRDVISTGSNDRSFMATGQLGDDDSGTGRPQFGTLRYVSTLDVIFGNGFEP